LVEKSVDQDNNDSGEIIYQQNKASNAEKELEQQAATKSRSYAINDQQQQQRGSYNRNGHLVGYQGHQSTSNYPNSDNFAKNNAMGHNQGNYSGHSGNMQGNHQRRSGSSKPKKKSNGQQPIKIIKNINNNNYIFNNP
jgi:hypothetical protein